MHATDGTWRAARSTDATPALVATIVVALALGTFLIIRRATGALIEPLPPLPLALTALLLLAWSVTIRLRLRFVSPALHSAPTLAIALFAIALSFPANRAADWLIWLPVFMLNALAPAMFAPLPAPGRGRGRGAPPQTQPTTLLQNLSRSRTTSGEETIEGTLLAEFTPHERIAILHIAFCPPFERLPHVEAEVLDDVDATVKVAQVLHNGTRLEVRLPTATNSPLAISIGLLATDVLDN